MQIENRENNKKKILEKEFFFALPLLMDSRHAWSTFELKSPFRLLRRCYVSFS